MAHRFISCTPSARAAAAPARSTGAAADRAPWLSAGEAVTIAAAGAALGAFYLAPWLPVAMLAAGAFLALAYRMPLAGALWVLWTAPWYRFPKTFDPAALGPLAGGRAAQIEIAVVETALLLTVAAWGARTVAGRRDRGPHPAASARRLSLSQLWERGGRKTEDEGAPTRGNRSAPAVAPVPPSPKVGRGTAFPQGRQGEGHGPTAAPRSVAWWREALVSPLGLLLLAATVALGAAEHLREALREYRTVIVEPGLLALVLRDVLRTERHRWVVLHALAALGGFVGVQGVVRYYTGAEVTEAEGVWRAGAIYWSANHLALLLDRLAPIAVALALFAPVGGRARALYVAAGVAQGATVLLTFSKAGWLALGPALSGLALARNRRAALLAAVGFVALLAGALVLVPTERLLSAATSSQRVWLWQASLAMLRDHPLSGVGPDNFLYAYHNYMLPEAWREPDLSHPHNLILDFWLRLGILGTVALAWMLAGFARNTWRALRASGPGWTRAGAAGVGAAMAAATLHGLVDNSFFLIDLAYFHWALWMLQDSFAPPPEERRSLRPAEDGQGSAT